MAIHPLAIATRDTSATHAFTRDAIVFSLVEAGATADPAASLEPPPTPAIHRAKTSV